MTQPSHSVETTSKHNTYSQYLAGTLQLNANSEQTEASNICDTHLKYLLKSFLGFNSRVSWTEHKHGAVWQNVFGHILI